VFATALSTGSTVLFAVAAPRLVAPLAITAVICALAAAWLRESYLELLERLATDAAAYSIPAVRRFGERIVDPRERRRLAQLIDDLVDHGGSSLTLGVTERLTTHRTELREIARALANPLNTPRPTIVASCRRLLTRAAESPLYNDRLPDDELTAVVRQIHIGIADP
jgi:hypothetical protein